MLDQLSRCRPNSVGKFVYHLFWPELSWEEKSRYMPDDVPDRGGATVRMYCQLTPYRYRPLYDNKVVFSRFFGSLGLKVAEVYGIYDPAVGRTMDGRPLRDQSDERSWLERFEGESFVFKPAEGGKGRQILAFGSRAPGERGAFLTIAGERYDAGRLAAFAGRTAPLEDRDPTANPHAYLLPGDRRSWPGASQEQQEGCLRGPRQQPSLRGLPASPLGRSTGRRPSGGGGVSLRGDRLEHRHRGPGRSADRGQRFLVAVDPPAAFARGTQYGRVQGPPRRARRWPGPTLGTRPRLRRPRTMRA